MADNAQGSPVDRAARVAGSICAVLLLVALLASFPRTGHDLGIGIQFGENTRSMVLATRLFLGLACPLVLIGSQQRSWRLRFLFFGAAVLVRYVFAVAGMRLAFGPDFGMGAIGREEVVFIVGRAATFYGALAVAAMALGSLARNRSAIWQITGQVGVASCVIGVLALGWIFRRLGDSINARAELVYLWIGLILMIFLAIRALKEKGASGTWARRALAVAVAIALLQALVFPWIRPPIVNSFIAVQWMLENTTLHLIDWLALVGVLELSAPTRWPPAPHEQDEAPSS